MSGGSGSGLRVLARARARAPSNPAPCDDVAALHDALAALVDKVPTVAGALKTIEEVKKMARHASPQAEHRKNFFDSLTGQLCVTGTVWGRQLQRTGAPLTHSARATDRD